MRSALRFGIGAAVLVALVGYGLSAGEAKYTIKEVMAKAHKGGMNSLLAKATAGKATKEQVKELVDLYESLGANKPPKGDEEAWKKKTDELLAAAKAFANNEEGSKEKLKKAADCGGCHKIYK